MIFVKRVNKDTAPYFNCSVLIWITSTIYIVVSYNLSLTVCHDAILATVNCCTWNKPYWLISITFDNYFCLYKLIKNRAENLSIFEIIFRYIWGPLSILSSFYEKLNIYVISNADILPSLFKWENNTILFSTGLIVWCCSAIV